MTEDHSEIEKELRRFQPVATSDRLQQRLAQTLDAPVVTARPARSAWWQKLGFSHSAAALGWGLLSPAAVGALLFFVGRPVTVQTLPPAAKPLPGATVRTNPTVTESVNVVYQASDEGVELSAGRTPVRRVRYRSADHVQWRNPQTGAQWEVSYPREDVLLLPVRVE